MMRILYISPYLGHCSNAVGETSRQIVRELRNAGTEVVTFPSTDREGSRCGPAVGSNHVYRQLIRKFSIRYLPGRLRAYFLEFFLVARALGFSAVWCGRIWLLRKALRPDVVLARALEYDWTPWIAARILGRPLVLETHSPNYVERVLRGLGKSAFARWLDQVLWERADQLWVVSHDLGKILASNGIDPEKIHVISLGVTGKQFAQSRVRSRGAITKIIFVGSFHPWQGVSTLLEAFASALQRVDNLRLILVGDGITRADNEGHAKDLGISEYVEFTGWLSLDDVSQLLNTADIAVASYDRLERFHFDPVKILEYMAAGLAVIASDQGEVPTMLNDGRNGVLVPPGEVEPLADAMVRLAKDFELRQRMGQESRSRVATHYDWSVTIQQVLSLCHKALVAYGADHRMISSVERDL